MEAIADMEARVLIGDLIIYDHEHGTEFAKGQDFYLLSSLLEEGMSRDHLFKIIIDGGDVRSIREKTK